jgi:hypothetical protein
MANIPQDMLRQIQMQISRQTRRKGTHSSCLKDWPMGRALTTNLFTLYLEISRDKSVLHATPLPANKQNTTPAKSNMGHTHLSSLEQSCQGATSHKHVRSNYRHCKVQSIRLNTSTNIIWGTLGPERPPRWKSHPAEE